MIKKIFDFSASFFGLIIFSPILLPLTLLVWLQDFKNPFYTAKRIGKGDSYFYIVKLRSMIINADQTGVDSTSENDIRITKIGKIIRKFKLDELTQLWNVLLGQMSFVGPRPNVERETKLYTQKEKKLLTVKPGITDIASIVFSDEGKILEPYSDPDIAYNQLIRPRKNILALFYIENRDFYFDLKLIFFTILAIFNKPLTLKLLVRSLRKFGANEEILKIVRRDSSLTPMPPPGSENIVYSRNS
tara:strand:- start:15747 stop:16481 length:735 start_codon:yes stop_codon:yes gene_type:complete